MSSSSESVSIYNLSNLPTTEVVKGWSRDNVKEFLQRNRAELMLEENDINVLYDEKVIGIVFLRLNEELLLTHERFNLRYGPASVIAELVKQINKEPPVNTGKRQFIESNESSKKKKLDPLFESICNLVKNQKDQLRLIQQNQQNDVIKHDGELAVIEKEVLFVRKSYKFLYNELKRKSSKGGINKFLITGTSGIGKSCFLIYVLIQLLCEDATVIFQPFNDEYLYCFENLTMISGKYYDFLYLLNKSATWYLADGIISPKLVLAKTVVTLSPNGIRTRDFKEFDKRYKKKYYMGPWTLEELLSCRKLVFPLVPEKIVTNLFYRAGGVPRYVLQHVEASIREITEDDFGKDGRPNATEREEVESIAFGRIEMAISETDDFDKIIKCFNEDEKQHAEVSNRIIHRWPDETHCNYHFKWASPYVFDKIQEKLEKKAWDDCLDKIRAMRVSYLASAKGFLFECYVIHLFRTGGREFEIRKLEGECKGQFSIHSKPKVGHAKNASDFSKYNEDTTVVVPDKQNFGAVDLFITPDSILQITVSENHPIKQAELIKVINNMPIYIHDSNAKIRLYFVVPDEIYDKFKQQNYTTRDKDSKNDRPVKRVDPTLKNIEQWVLKIQITSILEDKE
nr:10953_t:CDS:2 [Entrophospora candida]